MLQSRIKVIVLLFWTMLAISGVSIAEEISWQGYERLGDEAKQNNRWLQAEEAYEKAIDLKDKATSERPDNDTASLLNKLGEMRFRRKNFKDAEAAYRRALGIYDWNLGPDDPSVADTLDLLGTSFLNQEDGRALAGPLYYRALAIREKALGPDHPKVAESLHKVGLSLYFDNGRLLNALPLFQRALKIREKAFGHNHLEVADTLSTMAFVYDLHNARDRAIPLYQSALEIQEKLLGPDAPEVLQTLYSLGSAYNIEREYAKAETVQKRRLTSLEAKLGPDHLEVASALDSYAFTLSNAGKEDRAQALRERAQKLRDKAKTRTLPKN